MRKLLTPLLVLALAGGAHAQSKKNAKIKKQTIKAIEGLQFDPVRLSMKRGEKLQIKLANTDPNDQPHNLVIIEPGSLKAIQDASLVVDADSIENHYVPDHKAVLASTTLVQADGSDTISFTPTKKGLYHYVCTFPGHAMVMYGAIYVDQRPPKDVAYDPNIPEYRRQLEIAKLSSSLEPERPAMMRAFLPNAGPAAIAVALPGDLNYCWDAGNCRLRYAWTGGFVDPRDMLNSNGSRFTKILGPTFWSSGGDENTFALDTGNPKARPDFQGYRMVEGLPEFRYLFDGLTVHERLTSEDGSLLWNLRIEKASRDLKLYAPGEVTASAGKRDGDFLVLDPKTAQNITLKISPSK